MPAKKSINRRDFIAQTVKASAAITCWNIVSSSKIFAASAYDVTIDLTQSENSVLSKVGGSMYVKIPANNENVIVVRISETEVSAFSSVCTHSGCKVNLPSGGVAVCPCHNSRFTAQGEILSGPATKNLPKYYALLSGTLIYVNRVPFSVSVENSIPKVSPEISLERRHNQILVNWNDPYSRPLSWTLFDTAGRKLLKNNSVQAPDFSIATHSLPRGNYVLEIITTRAHEITLSVTLF